MSNSNKAAKATPKTTPQATPTPRNFEAELIEAMEGATDAEYDEILTMAKMLRDCKRIVVKWRKAGLPDASLVEAVKAMVTALESTDDTTKAKAAGHKAFNRVMRSAERAAKPKEGNRGK